VVDELNVFNLPFISATSHMRKVTTGRSAGVARQDQQQPRFSLIAWLDGLRHAEPVHQEPVVPADLKGQKIA